MTLTAWVMLGVILAIALFFWSLPFWAEPRRAPKHRRPSGDLLLDHSNNDDLEDWPGALADANPQHVPQSWLDRLHRTTAREDPDFGMPRESIDGLEHEAWLRSMTDPQTPEDYARAHEGAERLRAAMHEQALQQGDEFIHEATDGSSQK